MVLLAAFALSLLTHAAIAIFVHPWRAEREAEPVVAMRKVRIVHLVRVPPATPRPQQPRRKTAMQPPHLAALPEHRALPALRGAGPTPAPEIPTPVPTARCTAADIPASVIAEPSPPPIEPATRALDVSGTASITVQLDRDGVVTGAAITESTGDPVFDALAVSMARSARYAPAQHACKAVASEYLFHVQFYAW